MSVDAHIVELIPAYILDCLDKGEAILVSEHLTACATCQSELRSYQEVADQLALAVPDAAPPPALKGRLLNRIQSSALPGAAPASGSWQQGLSRRLQWLSMAWGLVGLLLVLVLVLGSSFIWQQVNRPERAFGPEGMRAISLKGTGARPGAGGFIVISADGRNGALVVDRLPQLGPDQQYQLWLIREGERTSGALLSVDQDGYGGARIRAPRPLLDYTAVEVTIEPMEGSLAPAGEKVLSGAIQ